MALHARAENLAALVNGLLILVGPMALFFLGPLLVNDYTDSSTTVRAEDPAGSGTTLLTILGWYIQALLPFAALTAWRTKVHARRWLTGESRGWRGVAEAGLCGFLIAVFVLRKGIVTRPLEAPAYVIAYGGLALILGLILGLFLRTTALLVLRCADRRDPPSTFV